MIAPAARQVDNGRGILARDVVEQDFRMAGCRQSGDIDVVFDAERDAVQRPEPAGRAMMFLFGVARPPPARPSASTRMNAPQSGLCAFDLAEQCLHQLDRRQAAAPHRPRRSRTRSAIVSSVTGGS